MKSMIRLFVVYLFIFASTGGVAGIQGGSERQIKLDQLAFIKGADISFIPQIEDNGGVYKEAGIPKDPIRIFKDHGFNYARLKLWHTPAENYNNLEKILYMAGRIKAQGLKLLIDFHYSDTWADPGRQRKPKAWENISFDALRDSIYHYTQKVIQALALHGVPPDMVQLGNEINAGMLWNDGRVGGNFDANWPNFASLLKEAIRGVRESGAWGDSIKIMIHIANAANNSACRWFFDNLMANGVNFDVIGLSFYPWWHGTLGQVKNNLNDLANRYKKDIIIAEYAYPWTLQWFDNQNNIVGSQSQLHAGYPASVDGQALFIRDLMNIVRKTKDGRGKGLFYWAPEYISTPTFPSNWENNALFDFYGNVLKSMNVFLEEPDTLAPINVTMIVNTATHWDTLMPHHFVQLRGEIQGISYLNLPDGKKVAWDASSDLVMQNIGGDYWQVGFQMYPGDKLAYKIWTGYTRTKATYLRLGWEGPIIPYPGASENTRIFQAGYHDTVLAVQYYNSSSESRLQYWSPLVPAQDSIVLFFRVNLAGVIKAGRFNPAINGPVGVRGDPVASGGALHWDSTRVVLQREVYSVSNGSFWSGMCHIPRSAVQPGQRLFYKFYIENDPLVNWEASVPNREFVYTTTLIEQKQDTTLHWVYFDELDPLTKIEMTHREIPQRFILHQNYPNPFNSITMIAYSLPIASEVALQIYDINGKLIQTLVQSRQYPGNHQVFWDGTDQGGRSVAAGVYFCRLIVAGKIAMIKLALVK